MYKHPNMRKRSNAEPPSFCASPGITCYLKPLVLPRVGAHGWLDFVDVKKRDSTRGILIVNTMLSRSLADLVDISVIGIH
jgi:hypothetical protein